MLTDSKWITLFGVSSLSLDLCKVCYRRLQKQSQHRSMSNVITYTGTDVRNVVTYGTSKCIDE